METPRASVASAELRLDSSWSSGHDGQAWSRGGAISLHGLALHGCLIVILVCSCSLFPERVRTSSLFCFAGVLG